MTSNYRKLIPLLSGLLLALPMHAQSQTDVADAYDIDQQESILRVYVGRAGVLARMGHNHVMYTRELEGEINLTADRSDSSATFSFPVASLVVDDPAERERAGDGFDSQPGESAIEGTRSNMLGEGVLNADVFPTVSASITPLSFEGEQWQFAVVLDFQGNAVNLEVPGEVTITASTITVNSRFTLVHEDLGLSVFTALGGSLRVAEEIDFELTITGTVRN